jgi:MFS family permease
VADDVTSAGPRGSEPPERLSLLERLRGHLIDLTPLRRSRDFRLLFAGLAVSHFGTEITFVAVPFQVWRLTHSTLAVGLLGLCDLVPLLVTPILGGLIADAFERRRFVLAVHVVLGMLSAALVANGALPHPHLWALYAFATLHAALYGLYRPAIDAWPVRLVGTDLLPSALALEMLYYNADGLAGPALAGVLIAWLGVSGVYLIDVATFVVAIACLAAMRPSPPGEEAPAPGLHAILEGLRFLRGKPVLQMTFVADLNAMVFGMPLALFPAVADRLGVGATGLGFLYAAGAGGSLLASLFSGRLRHVRRQGRAILLAIVVWGGAIVGFGLARSLWLAIAFLAIAHAGDLISGVYRSAIAQTVVSDELRGRLNGMGLTVWTVGPALGDIEAGAVASLVSVPFAVVSGGLACVLGATVIWALVPAFRRYDAADPRA